jgi:hypothetical protein
MKIDESELIGISNAIYLAGAGGKSFDGVAAIKALIAAAEANGARELAERVKAAGYNGCTKHDVIDTELAALTQTKGEKL